VHVYSGSMVRSIPGSVDFSVVSYRRNPGLLQSQSTQPISLLTLQRIASTRDQARGAMREA
jgi:hypothetical protein